MKISNSVLSVLVAGAIAIPFTAAQALADSEDAMDQDEIAEIAESRTNIDAMAMAAIQELVQSDGNARSLYEQSQGYAVFNATKAGLVVTGSGGSGVVVNQDSGERTYMRMGSAGVGLGAGVQNYRLVILFETEAALNKFVDGSWDAATSAQAAAGKSGVNVASSFVDNVAIFQLTNKGLMAQADLTGTRFWKSDELNL
jgi:lipid-binding SYLF domain-containing protein